MNKAAETEEKNTLPASTMNYINDVYKVICELSKTWHKQGLILREWVYHPNITDISDGINYVTKTPSSKWAPLGKIKEILSWHQIRNYSFQKEKPVSFYLVFDMLSSASLCTSPNS